MTSVSATVGTYRGEIYSAWSRPGSVCGSAGENTDLTLQCPPGGVIGDVLFASYGTPNGTCGHFQIFNCSSPNSMSTVQKACVGKSSCKIHVSNDDFGGDPCFDIVKHLDVQVTCRGGAMFSHSVTIPVNSMAEIHMSTFGEDAAKITVMESGKAVWKGGKYQPGQPGIMGAVEGKGDIVFQAGSGRYDFEVSM